MPSWFSYLQAALQFLIAAEKPALELFHGGAANTVEQVSSAINIVAGITGALQSGQVPTVDTSTVHPAIAEAAQAHAAANP